MPRGPLAKVPDSDFIQTFEQYGAADAARRLGMSVRAVFSRRERIEQKIGRQLTCPDRSARATRHSISHPRWLTDDVQNGYVIVGSDAHYWPDEISTAHRALVKLCKELKPQIVVMNGDMIDGARISRHAPIGWENRPSVIQEIETTQERLGEVEKAAGKARRYWPLGNHDARFETRLATVAPEYAKVHGVHLRDHFPLWEPCWALCINDSVVVKHRFKGGIHATHNGTLWAGKTMVTGHLHSLKVTPFSDYNGVRYGVDTGTLADVYGPQFEDYTEQGPMNWRSGFVVLTFKDGRLLWPDVCHVFAEGRVEFQGREIAV